MLSLEKPDSTWRPEPAWRGSENHTAAPRRPAPAEDRQLPDQEVGAIFGEVPCRQGAGPFSLKGAPRASRARGRSKALRLVSALLPPPWQSEWLEPEPPPANPRL